jgi:hypothetical protein
MKLGLFGGKDHTDNPKKKMKRANLLKRQGNFRDQNSLYFIWDSRRVVIAAREAVCYTFRS